MTKSEIFKFIRFLKKQGYRVAGPAYQPDDGRVVLKSLDEPARDMDFTGRVPYFSFKDIVFPARHALFDYQGADLTEAGFQFADFRETAFPSREQFFKGRKKAKKTAFSRIAVLMVSFVDLRALGLYHKVYENDAYYQALKEKTLIVGTDLFEDSPETNHWGAKYSREFLAHCPFDLFLETSNPKWKKSSYEGEFKVLTGSEKGKEILAAAKIGSDGHVDYLGPELWGDLEKKMAGLQERMEYHYDEPIWKWLGERCIECGQCTLVCPTCFCFDICDQPAGKDAGIRERYWNTCFYANFSEVGAPPRPGTVNEGSEFLNTTAKKIHFWYFHKFGRIPKDYNIEGCVGCGRCTRACPVYIDLVDTMKLVEKGSVEAKDVMEPAKDILKRHLRQDWAAEKTAAAGKKTALMKAPSKALLKLKKNGK